MIVLNTRGPLFKKLQQNVYSKSSELTLNMIGYTNNMYLLKINCRNESCAMPQMTP